MFSFLYLRRTSVLQFLAFNQTFLGLHHVFGRRDCVTSQECIWVTRGPLKCSTAINVLVRSVFISFLETPEKAVDVLQEQQGRF